MGPVTRTARRIALVSRMGASARETKNAPRARARGASSHTRGASERQLDTETCLQRRLELEVLQEPRIHPQPSVRERLAVQQRLDIDLSGIIRRLVDFETGTGAAD